MNLLACRRSAFLGVWLGLAVWLACCGAGASVIWVEARDVRSRDQSPWKAGMINGSVFIEDFLAGAVQTRTFVTPYISSPAGFKGDASGYYSVDGDDGVVDDFGRFGGSYTAGVTKAADSSWVSFRFDFTRNASGDLPRSVGLVVTNAILNAFTPLGNRSVAAAFDEAGVRLGEWVIDDMPLSIVQSSPEWRPYHTNGAQFVGAISETGIASFTITGAHHVDHVQYSFDAIPEPEAWMLSLLAIGWWRVTQRVRQGRGHLADADS